MLAGGCFWCVEAVFLPVEGVERVRSGYAGDSQDTANYQAVCSGQTNHAEVVEVAYDPNRVTFGRLLQLFFGVAHDPTQLNRQGHDQGRQVPGRRSSTARPGSALLPRPTSPN